MAGFGFPTAFNVSGLQGDPVFFDEEKDTDPGNTVTMFTIVVGAGIDLSLLQLLGGCTMPGKLSIKHEGSEIGTSRTEAGSPNLFFSWPAGRPIAEGETVTVEFDALPNQPVVPVDVHLMATEQT